MNSVTYSTETCNLVAKLESLHIALKSSVLKSFLMNVILFLCDV